MQIHRYQAYAEIMKSDYGQGQEHAEDLIARMLTAENRQLLWIYMEAYPDANVGIYGGHDAFLTHYPDAWKEMCIQVASDMFLEWEKSDLFEIFVGLDKPVLQWEPNEVLEHWLLLGEDIPVSAEKGA